MRKYRFEWLSTKQQLKGEIAAIRVKPELKRADETVPEKKKREAIITVRKEASSGGGC